MQQQLISFFKQVIATELKTLESINSFQGNVSLEQNNSVVIFTLSGLYEFLNLSKVQNFSVFKKQLYTGNINERLRELGGCIEVYKSTGKIDKNEYIFSIFK